MAWHREPPTVHIRRLGNFANQMIQFMTAQAIAAQVDGCKISNVDIPLWDIHHPDNDATGTAALTFGHEHETQNFGAVDVPAIVAAMRRDAIDRVNLNHYCQNVENFLPPSAYNAFFPPDPSVGGAADDELLIHIRLGDIADGSHLDYVLLPVEFYEVLVRNTGLRPVFIGQLDPGAYLQRLKEAFPDARYISRHDVLTDFQYIRNSAHIVPAVSTFSWCAAWLAAASARVYFPVAGLFHPMQSRNTGLLPLGDPRYDFWLFPVYVATEQEAAVAYHRRIHSLIRLVQPNMLHNLGRAPRYAREKSGFIAAFDEAFYLARFADVQAAVAEKAIGSGLTHYVTNGFDENRPGFQLDPNRYYADYAVAALEVSQGDYVDAHHHYVAIGRARGYAV